MADWFTERHDDRYAYGFAWTRKLVDRRTRFQHVEVYETEHFGRLLVLDGAVQLAEGLEFAYHESLVHPAMTLHPGPRRVLVLGGGDGGAAREVLKHPSVERVDLVDIDDELVSLCREHLPSVNGGGFDDPRLSLHTRDAAEFLGPGVEPYDVIVTDFTDPVGPAESVYRPGFYASLLETLAPGGRLAMQAESAVLLAAWHERARGLVRATFPASRLYHQYLQMYGGLWSFAVAARDAAELAIDEAELSARLAARSLDGLRLYGAATHRAMFDGFAWAERPEG